MCTIGYIYIDNIHMNLVYIYYNENFEVPYSIF